MIFRTPIDRNRVVALSLVVATYLCAETSFADEDSVRNACVADAESGQQLLKSGKPLAAAQTLLRCSQPACPGVVRRDCLAFYADAQAATPSVVIGVSDAQGHDLTDVRVVLDGIVISGALSGQPTSVEPGSHTLRFEKVGYAPIEQTFVARDGEKQRPIDARFGAPLDAPGSPSSGADRRPIPIVTYALAGVALVGAGAATYFGVRGVSERSSSCTASHVCGTSTYNDINVSFDLADLSIAVTALAIIGVGWTYAARPRSAAPQIRAAVGAHSEGIQLVGTF